MATMYKKRAGTSGISGQLYETKLISLILFRLLHNDNIEDFYLASNMDEIGAFDDVCVKMKIKGIDKPLIAFIQVKHKDNDDTFITVDNKTDSAKWCDSIVKIRQKFNSNKNQNEIVSGKFDEVECLFILYTNAKYNFEVNPIDQCSVITNLNAVISTNNVSGCRIVYSDLDVEDLSERISNEDITILAERFVNYLNTKQSMNVMNDEHITKYHVLLGKTILDVSEIQYEEKKPDSKFREISFRRNIKTNDKYVDLLLKRLHECVIKLHVKLNYTDIIDTMDKSGPTIEELISSFLTTPTATKLSHLIDIHITYRTGKLTFTSERPSSDTQKLAQIQIVQSVIDDAKEIAANKILNTMKLKVPIAFGNKDLAIRGNKKKIEKRLHYLTDIFLELCEKHKQSESYKIVTINDTLDEGLLSSNGGLGGTVGNLLVLDELTNLLKFSSSTKLQDSNAKNLLLNLESKIQNINVYRFNIKTGRLPKLSFSCTDTARDFLQKLILYPKQVNHNEVEIILKKDIEEQLRTSAQGLVNVDTLFLHYHDEVQRWWMTPKTVTYVTRDNNLYYHTINNIVLEPQMSSLENSFHITKTKYFGYKFNEKAIMTLKFIESVLRVNIVTDITTLTTIKVIQCLKNKYSVLDLQAIINLRDEDFHTLITELRKTEKIVIIVFENLQNSMILFKRLDELKQVMATKKAIVITSHVYTTFILKYFPSTDNIIHKEDQCILNMTNESINDILQNSTVLFQGVQVNCKLLTDKVSLEYVKGAVLDNLIKCGEITLAETLSDSNYEEMKDMYIERRICKEPQDSQVYYGYNSSDDEFEPETNIIQTFYHVKEDVVFITAKPGMGKSTLLTHLSIKTKESYRNVWILRINLLYYSRDFYKWQDQKTNVNIMQIYKFLCKVVMNNDKITVNIKQISDKILLENCTGGEWDTFRINMFLHFLNKGKLILLCDGFDEICPHYKNTVLNFLKILKELPQKHKIWVTSRPYSDILPDLKSVLGKPYVMEYLNCAEQRTYLETYWTKHISIDPFNESQISRLKKSLHLLTASVAREETNLNDKLYTKFRYICYLFTNCLNIILPKYSNDDPPNEKYIVDQEKLIKPTFDKLLGTPLVLYLVAEYFFNLTGDDADQYWLLDTSIIDVYKSFIETKLKKVLFQDKNKMDVYNPDIMLRYEKQLAESVAMHRKLAAHDVFGSPIFCQYGYFEEFKDMGPFTDDNSKEYLDILNQIKKGSEKVGLISGVYNNKPVFTHRTFLEHFAADFICDIFKSHKYDIKTKSLIWILITKYYNVIEVCIRRKKDFDLDVAITIDEEIEKSKRIYFTRYRKLICHHYGNWTNEQYIRILNSYIDDYNTDCFEGCNADDINIFDMMGDPVEFVRKLNANLVDKMRPHVKKYFI